MQDDDGFCAVRDQRLDRDRARLAIPGIELEQDLVADLRAAPVLLGIDRLSRAREGRLVIRLIGEGACGRPAPAACDSACRPGTAITAVARRGPQGPEPIRQHLTRATLDGGKWATGNIDPKQILLLQFCSVIYSN